LNQILTKYPQEVERILAKYPPEYRRSAVMPLLWLVQGQAGRITPQAVTDIAEITGLSTTEVTSITGFYTLFHEEGGRYHIQVCTDLPCALGGADEFLRRLSAALGIGVGETTPDGLFTIEEVKCVAACHRAPVFQLQGDGDISFHEHQTVESAMALVAELREKAAGGDR
jgi:NADH-quinone oxidoreductase subunit E